MAPRIFLPGAAGNGKYWLPVATRLRAQPGDVFLSWPGLGRESPLPSVRGLDDLVAIVLGAMREPTDLFAQSLGGVVALRAALARPDMVRRLVLVATSGGVPVQTVGASDWRDDYYRMYPGAGRWIGEVDQDLSGELRTVWAPTLLIWGDQDPISPLAVGSLLEQLLPSAELRIVSGGDHDMVQSHPQVVAGLINAHFGPPQTGTPEPAPLNPLVHGTND